MFVNIKHIMRWPEHTNNIDRVSFTKELIELVFYIIDFIVSLIPIIISVISNRGNTISEMSISMIVLATAFFRYFADMIISFMDKDSIGNVWKRYPRYSVIACCSGLIISVSCAVVFLSWPGTNPVNWMIVLMYFPYCCQSIGILVRIHRIESLLPSKSNYYGVISKLSKMEIR